MEADHGDGGIGAGGSNRGKKVPNAIKQEHKRRSQNPDPQPPVVEEAFDEPQRDFGDGSRLIHDWTSTHLELLGIIEEQSQDDCWARVFRRILEFNYNMNIQNAAERKTLSMGGLISAVKDGRVTTEAKARAAKKKSLIIPSLKKPIKFIREIGLEKDFGRANKTNKFRVKGDFLTKPNATAEDIRDLLVTKGLVGIIVHMEPEFVALRNEIYTLKIPQGATLSYDRHALIIVSDGYTLDGKIFFLVQNTWGKSWGVGGYGRIIIAETCPIVYLNGLIK